MRVFRIFPALAVLAAIAALTPSTWATTPCNAELRARAMSDQITDEATVKVFAVEVDTQEACATVSVDFVVTERLFNGEEITTTRRGWRKVTSRSNTHKANYRIARDSTLVNWEFKVAGCVVCGTE